MTYETRHIRIASFRSQSKYCQICSKVRTFTGYWLCQTCQAYLMVWSEKEESDKLAVTRNQMKVLWLEFFHWKLAAQARGPGLIPSACQFSNHFPSSHYQMWLELSVITTTPSPSTYPSVLTDDAELDASGVGDEQTLLCLISEAASGKIP